VCIKEKGVSMSKHRTSNFPLAHLLNEDCVLPLDWMMDEPLPVDVGMWGQYK